MVNNDLSPSARLYYKNRIFNNIWIFKRFTSNGGLHASEGRKWERRDAKNHYTKKARKDGTKHRGAVGRAPGWDAGAVLEGTSCRLAGREGAPGPLRSELHRRCRAGAAEGNLPSGWGVGCRRVPEPGDCRRDREDRERQQEPQPERASQGITHRFLHYVVQPFDRGGNGACAVQCKSANAAGGCTNRGAAADAGSSCGVGAQAEPDGPDRDFDRGTKRAGQKHCAGRVVATSERA